MPETGYGSEPFLRACRVAPACRRIEGRGLRSRWDRVRAGSMLVRWYCRNLPSVRLRLTASPAGEMIAAHFSIRDGGRWRYRTAQGVLPLPPTLADYLRGRHRQAVRTNVGHARRAGLVVYACAIDNWAPGADDTRAAHIAPGPVERWMVLDAEGTIVADSILSVDEEVALLQGLVSWCPNARWLLHTAIVERLCGSCKLLLTNSDDAFLLAPGNQHFQRLLGYRIARLQMARSRGAPVAAAPPEPAGLAWPPDQLTCGVARLPTPVLLAA